MFLLILLQTNLVLSKSGPQLREYFTAIELVSLHLITFIFPITPGVRFHKGYFGGQHPCKTREKIRITLMSRSLLLKQILKGSAEDKWGDFEDMMDILVCSILPASCCSYYDRD